MISASSNNILLAKIVDFVPLEPLSGRLGEVASIDAMWVQSTPLLTDYNFTWNAHAWHHDLKRHAKLCNGEADCRTTEKHTNLNTCEMD